MRVAEALERIAEELGAIGETMDRIRDDLGWALNNEAFRSPPPLCPLTSMPKDPLADDFGERLNAVSPDDVPADVQDADASSPTSPTRQGELWE